MRALRPTPGNRPVPPALPAATAPGTDATAWNVERGPLLTVVVVVDAEKAHHYLRSLFQAVDLGNRDALPWLQWIVVHQGADDSGIHDTAARYDWPVDVVFAGNPIVDGHPIWDTQAMLRRVRPLVRGRYLSLWHAEYCPHVGALRGALDWLMQQGQPLLALGNLRRFGRADDQAKASECGDPTQPLTPAVRDWSARYRRLLAEHDLAGLAAWSGKVPDCPWLWKKRDEALASGTTWLEDVFFVRTDWLDATRLLHHADRLCFQDIFDLLTHAMRRLKQENLAPEVRRVPLHASRIYHLWHGKGYSHFTPAVQAWFQRHPALWDGTLYTAAALWDDLQRYAVDPRGWTDNPLHRFRLADGGSRKRFADAFDAWLAGGGADALRAFYALIDPDAGGRPSVGPDLESRAVARPRSAECSESTRFVPQPPVHAETDGVRIIVVSRFNLRFPTLDLPARHTQAWTDERLELFGTYALPAMQRQTVSAWEWWLLCDPKLRALTDPYRGRLGDPRVRMIDAPDGCMPRDMSLAGDFQRVLVVRVDSDDMLHPNALARMVRLAAGAQGGSARFVQLGSGWIWDVRHDRMAEWNAASPPFYAQLFGPAGIPAGADLVPNHTHVAQQAARLATGRHFCVVAHATNTSTNWGCHAVGPEIQDDATRAAILAEYGWGARAGTGTDGCAAAHPPRDENQNGLEGCAYARPAVEVSHG